MGLELENKRVSRFKKINARKSLFLLLASVAIVAVSCKKSNNLNDNMGGEVNRYNPTLMVFPSDALLKRLDCLNEIDNQGTVSYDRNYSKSFVQDSELKFVIANVEGAFSKSNYPLENLEQQLKQINNEKTMDAMESISTDARTQLLNTARPDFIIEVDYEYKQDPSSRNPKKILTYILTAIDVYTNKNVATITRSDIGNDDGSGSLAALIQKDLNENISDFQQQINNQFKDIIDNGVEITLRINTDENANLALGDECLGTENYNDWVNNWLKKNTVHSSFKSVKNSDKELKFTNVRIKTLTPSGEKYTAFDFASDLKRDISKSCGISCVNKTQGIADAYLVIKGLK
jgi:hypothetical protein